MWMVRAVLHVHSTVISNNVCVKKAVVVPNAISARPATTNTQNVLNANATSQAPLVSHAIRLPANVTANRISSTISVPNARPISSTIRSVNDVVVTPKVRPIISQAVIKNCVCPLVLYARVKSTLVDVSVINAKIDTMV